MSNYTNRGRNNRSSNNGNSNNGSNNNYFVTTKSDVQFYNSTMSDDVDNSTLSFSYWKNNLLISIYPMFSESERKQLEEGDNRVFNYDAPMSIAIDAKSAYKFYKAICTLENLIKKGSKATCVAVRTSTKVIKVGTGAEYGLDNWYVGIFQKDSAEGLIYFFNKDTESDEIIFNYNEETFKGQVKTTNTELDIFKDILREAPLMLSKGYVHEVRQELSKLKSHIDSKLQGGTSTGGGRSTSASSTSITNRRRRPGATVSQPVVENTEFDPTDFQLDDETTDFEVTFTEPKEERITDISDLEDDFAIDDEE